MAVTVGTDSYVTEDELTTYAGKRGISITGDKSILLYRAMDYLETRKYIGQKTVYNQPLQFPRVICDNAYPYNNYPQNYNNVTPCEYDSLTVPIEIKTAQIIGAILIGQGYDLQAVVGQSVKREKVDVIEVEYQDYTTSAQQFTALNDILKPFIVSGSRVMRG
jgi:hypothetical protein